MYTKNVLDNFEPEMSTHMLIWRELFERKSYDLLRDVKYLNSDLYIWLVETSSVIGVDARNIITQFKLGTPL